jgi:hypothetical protein
MATPETEIGWKFQGASIDAVARTGHAETTVGVQVRLYLTARAPLPILSLWQKNP